MDTCHWNRERISIVLRDCFHSDFSSVWVSLMCLFARWSHIKGESLRERPHLIYLCFSFTTVHKTTWRHDVSCWWKVKVCRRSLHYLCHPAAQTFNSIQSDHIKFSVYFLYFSFPFVAVHLSLNPHMCCSQLPTFTPIICSFQVKQFEMWRAVFIWSSSFFLAGYQSPPSENLGFSARWLHLKTKLASSQTSTSCWPTPGATLAEKQEVFGRLNVNKASDILLFLCHVALTRICSWMFLMYTFIRSSAPPWHPADASFNPTSTFSRLLLRALRRPLDCFGVTTIAQ